MKLYESIYCDLLVGFDLFYHDYVNMSMSRKCNKSVTNSIDWVTEQFI